MNGRIASSEFGKILHRQESIDSRRLVRNLMGYGGPMQNPPPQMCWGRENDDKA